MSAAHRALVTDVLPAEEQVLGNAWGSRLAGVGSVLGYLLGEADLPWWLPLLHSVFGLDQLGILAVLAALGLLCTHAPIFACTHESRVVGGAAPASRGLRQLLHVPRELYETMKMLPESVRGLFAVQFLAWLAWFPVLFFSVAWVANIYRAAHGDDRGSSASNDEVGDRARRVGSFAMFCYACVSLATSIVLPFFLYDGHTRTGYDAARSEGHERLYAHAERYSSEDRATNDGHAAHDAHAAQEDDSADRSITKRAARSSSSSDLVYCDEDMVDLASAVELAPRSRIGRAFDAINATIAHVQPHREPKSRPQRWRPTLAESWLASHVLFGTSLLFGTCAIHARNSVIGATILMSILGVSWSLTNWAPFTLLNIMLFHSDRVAHGEHITLARLDGQRAEAAAISGGASADLRAHTGTIMGLHNFSIVLPQLVVSLASSAGTPRVPRHTDRTAFAMPHALFDGDTAERFDSTGLLFRLGSICTLAAAYRTLHWARRFDPAGA